MIDLERSRPRKLDLWLNKSRFKRDLNCKNMEETNMFQWLSMAKSTRLEMLTESTLEEDEIIDQHFAYLEDLTQKGVITLVGRTLNTDRTGFGLTIFTAEDETEAREIMENDPAIKSGLMAATLYPFRVALSHK
jgi:uncharacterized protein YciI